jgi:periplasmic protein TonB
MIRLKENRTIITLSAFLLFICFSLNAIAEDVPAAADDEEQVYITVEEMPSFPGGLDALHEYLKSNIRYPQEERDQGVEGIVLVSFIVREDGSLSDIKVERSISDGLSEEAVRIISSMPDWEPGYQKGEAVSTQVQLPIRFALRTYPVPVEEDGQ